MLQSFILEIKKIMLNYIVKKIVKKINDDPKIGK